MCDNRTARYSHGTENSVVMVTKECTRLDAVTWYTTDTWLSPSVIEVLFLSVDKAHSSTQQTPTVTTDTQVSTSRNNVKLKQNVSLVNNARHATCLVTERRQ